MSEIQTCYRHGDRRAGVICQRCDKPICPDCMRQASVGFHCPDCAKAGKQKVYSASSLSARLVITPSIIAINALVFLFDMRSSTGSREGDLTIDGALIGIGQKRTSAGTLVDIGVAAGDWWRPITGGFLHASLIHVGMNMFLLYMLGQLLEPALGRLGFATLYVMSLLGGSFLVLTLDPDALTVGASGAVFGLMGAAFVGLRSRGIDPFSTGIGGLLVINLVLTFFIPGISIGGHVGGLAAGAAGGWAYFHLAPRLAAGKVIVPMLCTAASLGLFAACIFIADHPI